MIIELDSVTARLLALSLDASVMKQEVIANNIANINSVGFIPKAVTFERYLQDVSGFDGSGETELSQSQVNDIEQKLKQGDFVEEVNAGIVELDTEMVKLTKNVIHYQTLIQAMSSRSQVLKLAISEGK